MDERAKVQRRLSAMTAHLYDDEESLRARRARQQQLEAERRVVVPRTWVERKRAVRRELLRCPPGTVTATCWCEREVVFVRPEQIGCCTDSCGAPRCTPPVNHQHDHER